ncbi:MAG: hypothetical protein IKQ61_10295 [Spirochaetales bacterium]|nr:hypothetical protein [Spirochaetales bacterium]MBR6061473.1 hypothetical protein [Spirochaetales bacterium]MBR6200638.1 hypothetical protein [Spirochaetales bacterium]
MKRIVFLCLFSLCLSAFAYAEFKDIVTDPWVRAASLTRQTYVEKGDVYELIQYDRDILGRIYNGDLRLNEEGSKRLLTLMHQVVIDNPRPDEKSLVKAIDILAQKLDDKSYCANFLLELVSTNKIPNYRVMVKVMDTFAVILTNETSGKIFMALSMMYGKLDAFLFDPYAPGADMVLRSFMEFIAQYCDLVTNKKTLNDDYRGKICEFADKLDLGKKVEGNKMSQYAYLKNWERTGQAFYFYKLKEEYDLGDDDQRKATKESKGM